MLAASYVPCDINNPDQVTIDYRDVAPIDARLRVMIAPGGHIRIQKAVDDGDYIDDSGEWQTVATVVDDDDEKAWDQIRTPEAMIYDTEAFHDEDAWHEALRTNAVKLVRRRLEETPPPGGHRRLRPHRRGLTRKKRAGSAQPPALSTSVKIHQIIDISIQHHRPKPMRQKLSKHLICKNIIISIQLPDRPGRHHALRRTRQHSSIPRKTQMNRPRVLWIRKKRADGM